MSFRYHVLFVAIVILFLLNVGRLFYWQIVKAEKLIDLAKFQYNALSKATPKRGKIKTSDGFPLVANKISYVVFANPREIRDKNNVLDVLSPILKEDTASLSSKMSLDKSWVSLKKNIDIKTKQEIEKFNLKGIGFDQRFSRFYPEASMAAQLVGFVGGNDSEQKGYFGLEGYYDRLLRGKEGYISEIHDALGNPILLKRQENLKGTDGSNIILTINRSIQFLVEEKIKKGIEKYGASGGMVGIMDPRSGDILAMASFPSFLPNNFQEYDQNLYKNPFISNTFEPGSTLKPIIMASALDANLITPFTRCPICYGPVQIGEYSLHTWNDKYYKDTNMIDVIKHSDNTGMVFVAQKLGVDRMISYLDRFGIGKMTDIDLQGESLSPLKPRNTWYGVDLATTGFGQGISVTPIELLVAFSSLANKGELMQPRVVKATESPNGEIFEIPSKVKGHPISQNVAKIMTEILVNAVEKGEANWTKLKGYRIAGKTGTASIPVAGHYDPDITITSFIGFAPADDPKFAMLVILDKPVTSIYAAETAAPVFFDIARDLLSYYGISPNE